MFQCILILLVFSSSVLQSSGLFELSLSFNEKNYSLEYSGNEASQFQIEPETEAAEKILEKYVGIGAQAFLQYASAHATETDDEKRISLKNQSDLQDFSFTKFGRKAQGFKLELSQLQQYNETDLKSRPGCIFDPQDVKASYGTLDLLKKEGFPTESHYVQSADGYIVEFHRIPAPGKPVVLVYPGIFQSSRDYLYNCRGRTLVHKLFNGGFDIWLGNYRGGTYGRNHTSLDPNTLEFWEFGGDEAAKYDGPAAVNYILAQTGEKKLNWVGYSLGTSMLFAFLSVQPQFNDKINVGITMAPAVYFGRTKAWPIIEGSRFRHLMAPFLKRVLHGEFLPPHLTKILQKILPKFCIKEAVSGVPGQCAAGVGMADGKSNDQINLARLPTLLRIFPSAISSRMIAHWFQWVVQPDFRKFDFGPSRNLLRYGSLQPPLYNLSQVTAPIVMFWGGNDYITVKEDVHQLMTELPNVEAAVRVNWTSWNHMDFIYGKDADILVYDSVITVLKYKTNPKVMPPKLYQNPK